MVPSGWEVYIRKVLRFTITAHVAHGLLSFSIQ